MIRKITVKPAYTKIRCNIYPVGTKLYWKREEGKVYFSPEMNDFQGITYVNEYATTGGCRQLYIPAHHIIKRTGYYRLVLKDNVLEVELTGKKEEKNVTGKVLTHKTIHGIYLTDEDSTQLYKTGYVKMHIYLRPTFYAEAVPITKEEFEILPDQKDLGGFSRLRKKEDFLYRYGASISGQGKNRLSLPISFMEKITAPSLATWWEGNHFIVSGQPSVCDCCGRPISPRVDAAYDVQVQKKETRKVQVLTEEQKLTVLEQLQQIEKMYKKLEESL